MRLPFLASVCAVALALPTSGSAAEILRFNIFGDAGSADYTFTFDLDTSRSPSFQVPNSVTRFSPTPITFTRPGSTEPITTANVFNGAGPSFFTAFNQGGISLLRLPEGGERQVRFFGPQLFTGPTTAPEFLTGSFRLTREPRNNPNVPDTRDFNYTVTISAVAAAVPEPATWAMLVLGFGAIGFALRRREQGVRVRYAWG